MSEQTDKQPATPDKGAEASAPAAGNAPVQGAITPEAVQSYLKSNPDAWKTIKIPAKIDGKDIEVPLVDARDNYQLRSASQAKFEEAARLRAEVDAEKAKLAEQGDPIKQLLARLTPKPAQPETPLEGLDFANDPFVATPKLAEVTRELWKKNQELAAKNKELESKLPEVEKLANNALQAQRDYETRMRIERDFEQARQHNPDFTGRLVVREGKFQYDLGSNPTVTAEAIRLANSETPDERLGGKAGVTMSLPEIVDAIAADTERRIDERRAAQAAAKQERLKNLAGMAPAGAVMPEPTAKTTILPTDDLKTIKEKTALIKREIQEEMAAKGLRG